MIWTDEDSWMDNGQTLRGGRTRVECEIESILAAAEMYPNRPVSQRDLDARATPGDIMRRYPDPLPRIGPLWGEDGARPLSAEDARFIASVLTVCAVIFGGLAFAVWLWANRGPLWA